MLFITTATAIYTALDTGLRSAQVDSLSLLPSVGLSHVAVDVLVSTVTFTFTASMIFDMTSLVMACLTF